MQFTSRFVDRTGNQIATEKSSYKAYFITINPNVRKSQDEPDYQEFRDYFFYKLNQIYSRDRLKVAIDQIGEINWGNVVVTADTSMEFGEQTQKLHSHTEVLLKIPRHEKDEVSISYKKFGDMVREQFANDGLKGIYVNIRPVNTMIYYVRDYNNKMSSR